MLVLEVDVGTENYVFTQSLNCLAQPQIGIFLIWNADQMIILSSKSQQPVKEMKL